MTAALMIANMFGRNAGWCVLAVSLGYAPGIGLAQELDWWEEDQSPSIHESSSRAAPNDLDPRTLNPLQNSVESFAPDSGNPFTHPPTAPETSGAGATQACAGWLLPTWYTNRDTAGQFVGVGGPEATAEDAEAKARLAVVKAIELAIIGDDSFFQEESTGGELTYAVRSSVVEKVNLSISGLEIQEVVINPCRRQYYALARLNQARALRAWRHALAALDSQASELETQIGLHQEQAEAFLALLGLDRLMGIHETARQIAQRVAYVSAQESTVGEWAAKVMQTQHRQEALLHALRLEKLAGDRQQASESPDLPSPFIVQAISGQNPMPRIPIAVTVLEGDLVAPAVVWTDEHGQASLTARHMGAPAGSGRITARIAVEQVSTQYSPRLQKRLLERTPQMSVDFEILPPLYHIVRELKDLSGQATALTAHVMAHRNTGEVFSALTALDELARIQNAWETVFAARLPATVAQQLALTSPGDATHTVREFESLLSAIHLKKGAGDGQSATLHKPLPQSLEVSVVTRLPDGEVPLPNVPLRFTFEQGSGHVDAHLQTDGRGQARARVHQVAAHEGETTIVATFDPEQQEVLSGQLSDAVRARLAAHLSSQRVRFTITPPWNCGASNPFDAALYRLACELAGKASEAKGKPTVVKDFTERQSGKRHQLSDRIEQAVERALARTGVFTVTSTPRTRGLDTRTMTRAIISGQYWAEKGGVRIQADLKYEGQGGTLFQDWDAEAFISKEHLTADEYGSLVGSSQPPALQAAVPSGSVATTHSAWVQEFWNLHNPRSSFKTVLRSERPAYVAGDKAAFYFKTERDCYLWVVSIGASGTGTVLFPNFVQPEVQDTLIRARDGWVKIPAASWKFSYQIGPPFGSERIKTICTTQPVQLIPQATYRTHLYQFTEGNGGFREFVPDVTTGQPPAYEWSDAQTSVKTRERG